MSSWRDGPVGSSRPCTGTGRGPSTGWSALRAARQGCSPTGACSMAAAEQWEPDDARVSCPVLRERGGAIPPRHSPVQHAEGHARQGKGGGLRYRQPLGWTFVPFLQAFGGNVFRNPPEDLTPTLDTPEAVAAAEYFARILKEFGPNGVLSYTPDQVVKALQSGRANYSAIGQTY